MVFRLKYKRLFFNERLVYSLKKPFKLYTKKNIKNRKKSTSLKKYKIGIFSFIRKYNNFMASVFTLTTGNVVAALSAKMLKDITVKKHLRNSNLFKKIGFLVFVKSFCRYITDFRVYLRKKPKRFLLKLFLKGAKYAGLLNRGVKCFMSKGHSLPFRGKSLRRI